MAAHEQASVIGRGCVIRGTIRGDGDLEIEGRVEGVVELDGDLALSDSGRLRVESGALSGRRVTVRGAVKGDIRGTEAIVLEAGARVVGDLAAPSIGIRPGGLLRGHVATGESVASAPRVSRAETRRGGEEAQKPAVRPPPPRRAPAPRPAPSEQAVAPAPRAPARAKGAPPPVMPALKKGAKAQMKKKAGK